MGAVDIEVRRRLRFLPGGTIEEDLWIVRHFLNEAGVRASGNLVFSVDAYRSKAVLRQMYTVHPGGDVLAVDRSNVLVQSLNEPSVFTDDYVVVVAYPDLRPGSIAVLAATLRYEPGRTPVQWSRVYYPQKFEPVEAYSVDVEWSRKEDRPAWSHDHPQLVEEAIGEQHVRFTLAPAPALPVDASPPSHEDLLPQLVVAEPISWRVLASRMARIVEQRLTGGPEVERLVEELGLDAPTEEERLSRLHRFITQEIRYVAIEHGQSGVEPRPSALTLSRRFGDCKDRTALFLDAARRLGLRAHAVLTSTRRYRLERLAVPASTYFNHMIACVTLDGGGERCLDLTNPFVPPTDLPAELAGAVRLDLVDSAREPSTFAIRSHGWNLDFKIRREIAEDGSVREVGQRRYLGDAAAATRARLTALDERQRQGWLEEGFEEEFGDSSGPELRLEGLERVGLPLVVHWTVEHPKAVDVTSGAEVAWHDGYLALYALAARSGNKHHPYLFQGMRLTGTVSYVLPSGYETGNTGATLEFLSRHGELRRDYVFLPEDRTLSVVSTLAVPRSELLPEAGTTFNRILGQFANETRHWFQIKKESGR